MKKTPETYREAIGLAFAAKCRARNLTQDQVADQLGCQQSTVSRMCTGRGEIPLSILRRWLSPEEIFDLLVTADRLLLEAKTLEVHGLEVEMPSNRMDVIIKTNADDDGPNTALTS